LAKEQVASPETPKELKPGERKMLQSIGLLEYYESLQCASVRPKARGTDQPRIDSPQPAEQSDRSIETQKADSPTLVNKKPELIAALD